MITTREVAYGTYGAWRLARGDRNGLTFFDNTPEAFWRSFYAALVAAPIFTLLVLLQFIDKPPASGPMRTLVVETISYVIGWVTFPLVMFYIVQYIDRFERYLRYIAAYNWAQVLQMLLLLVATSMAKSGVLPGALAAMIGLAAMAAVLAFQWYIARVALEVAAIGAVTIVLLDVLISVVLNSIAVGLLQSPG